MIKSYCLSCAEESIIYDQELHALEATQILNGGVGNLFSHGASLHRH